MQKSLFFLFSALSLLFIGMYYLLESQFYKPEFYTTFSINIINNWNKLNFFLIHGVPMISSDNSLNINANASRFYISHPPFSYYFYLFFKTVFGIKNIVWINFLLTAVSSFFIYLTICTLTLKKASKDFSKYALGGALLYLTTPAVISFQILNCHPDIFVQSLFIIFSYVFLKMMVKGKYRSFKYIFILSLLVFLMCYSSWIGFFYTSTILLFGLFNLRKGYKMISIVLISLFVSIFTLFMIYTQYAKIEGWISVIFTFKNIYLKQSLFQGHYFHALKNIVYHHYQYIGNMVLTLLILIGYSISKKNKMLFTKNGYKFLIISFVPLFLFYFIFFNYSQNAYVVLYLASPLAIVSAIWIEKLQKTHPYPLFSNLIFGWIMVLNIVQFLFHFLK